MNKLKKIIMTLLIVLCCLQNTNTRAFAPTNFFRSDDSFLKTTYQPNTKFNFSTIIEMGSTQTGRNVDGNSRNILALYNDAQDVITMLKNPTAVVKQKTGSQDPYIKYGYPSSNNGRAIFSGDFKQTTLTLMGSYTLINKKIPGQISATFAIPATSKKVENVACKIPSTSTTPIFPSSIALQELITNLKTKSAEYGNLDISDWKDSGFGDFIVTIDWTTSLKQDDENLKNITLFVKLGASIPTGKQKDEDLAFSMPFGNDGAWAFPAGLGLELDFSYNIKSGISIDLLHTLNKSRARRLKTLRNQTEILLLNKGGAVKSYGLTWGCNSFIQWYHFLRGLSAKATYQITTHHSDSLASKSSVFSNDIISTAKNLKSWYAHNIIFQLGYDFNKEFETAPVTPSVNLFYKIPTFSKGVIAAQTFGGQITFGF